MPGFSSYSTEWVRAFSISSRLINLVCLASENAASPQWWLRLHSILMCPNSFAPENEFLFSQRINESTNKLEQFRLFRCILKINCLSLKLVEQHNRNFGAITAKRPLIPNGIRWIWLTMRSIRSIDAFMRRFDRSHTLFAFVDPTIWIVSSILLSIKN